MLPGWRSSVPRRGDRTFRPAFPAATTSRTLTGQSLRELLMPMSSELRPR
ncbi:DNA mismatch repair protein MutT, partial [Xanthomonas perforans]